MEDREEVNVVTGRLRRYKDLADATRPTALLLHQLYHQER